MGAETIELAEALRYLGCTDEWIALGLFDAAEVVEKANGLAVSRTPTEHVRYGALMRWLSRQDKISDEVLLRVVRLLSDDVDRVMAISVLMALIDSPLIAEHQLRLLDQGAGCLDLALKRRLGSRLLLNKLSRGELSHEEFVEVVDRGDARVQAAALEVRGLPPEWRALLASTGATRAIRNRAKGRARG